MAIYTNITTQGTTTLITKGGNRFGTISKITIANSSDAANDARVDVILDDDGDGVFYIIKHCMIPKGATLVLNDNLSFNSSAYNLKMYNTGDSPSLTVIIK